MTDNSNDTEPTTDPVYDTLIAIITYGTQELGRNYGPHGSDLPALDWDVRREGLSTEIIGRVTDDYRTQHGHAEAEQLARHWAWCLELRSELTDEDTGRSEGWCGTWGNVAIVVTADPA